MTLQSCSSLRAVEMRTVFWLMCLFAASRGATAQPFDPLQVRAWAASCTGCHPSHGRDGSGMGVLTGLGREAMLAALLDFKSGRRPATVMQQLGRGYDDEQLQAISAYFSSRARP